VSSQQRCLVTFVPTEVVVFIPLWQFEENKMAADEVSPHAYATILLSGTVFRCYARYSYASYALLWSTFFGLHSVSALQQNKKT